MEKLKNNKEVEEKKKEAIIEASKSARERHGGNIRTAGMSLSLIQRMDTLKVPEKFFELDYLAANFPSFCSFVDKNKNKRRQYRKKTIAMAKNIALRHRSLKNITGDINFQPIFMPNFKMKKGERADERSTVKIP